MRSRAAAWRTSRPRAKVDGQTILPPRECRRSDDPPSPPRILRSEGSPPDSSTAGGPPPRANAVPRRERKSDDATVIAPPRREEERRGGARVSARGVREERGAGAVHLHDPGAVHIYHLPGVVEEERVVLAQRAAGGEQRRRRAEPAARRRRRRRVVREREEAQPALDPERPRAPRFRAPRAMTRTVREPRATERASFGEGEIQAKTHALFRRARCPVQRRLPAENAAFRTRAAQRGQRTRSLFIHRRNNNNSNDSSNCPWKIPQTQQQQHQQQPRACRHRAWKVGSKPSRAAAASSALGGSCAASS